VDTTLTNQSNSTSDGPERRRSKRYAFVAMAEVSEIDSDYRVCGRTTEISLTGCFLDMANPLPEGKQVFVKIFTRTEFFEANATVIYSQERLGVGLNFDDIGRHFQPTLQRWVLEGLRAALVTQE